MNVQALIYLIAPIVGQTVADAVKEQLNNMILGVNAPWKKAILALVGDAIQKHGVTGIQNAMDAVRDLLDDKQVDIDWADLAVASDILAHMQNAEAGRKNAVRAFLTQVGDVFGIILSALVKGLL